LELAEDVPSLSIVGYLGNDPGAEAESRSCGERVARVAAALDLELEAADLVVGVGEGRHRGQVVHVDGAAPEHDRAGAAGVHGGGGGTPGAATRTRRRDNPPARLTTKSVERSGGQLQLVCAGRHPFSPPFAVGLALVPTANATRWLLPFLVLLLWAMAAVCFSACVPVQMLPAKTN